MKHLLLSLGLCLALFTGASAQITTDKGDKSNEINLKIHEVDLLIQLLPLLLTKDQLNHDVLPTIEIVRDMERKELQAEDEALAGMEADLDATLKDAYEKGAYPARKVIDEVSQTTGKFATKQLLTQLQMVAAVTAMLEKTLNAGQKKVLINSFDPRFIDPAAKPETMTAEAKMNFYVKRVFLDPYVYNILKKLAK
jgi:hypothetical protein